MLLEQQLSKLAKLKVLGKEGTDVGVDANNKKRSVVCFSSKIQGDISEHQNCCVCKRRRERPVESPVDGNRI